MPNLYLPLDNKTVVVEASYDIIREQNLDVWEGEHFDSIENAIYVQDDGKNVVIESTRSLKAWKRGEPSAGRGLWTFPYSTIECVYVEGKPVWGKPGQ